MKKCKYCNNIKKKYRPDICLRKVKHDNFKINNLIHKDLNQLMVNN